MNANELADLLEVDSWYKLVTREEIATMLRQQQAEIEALKGEVAYLKHINRNWAISEGWALKEIEALKAKTLTDEEIDAVGDAVSNHIDTYAGRREFARAILRKAQE